MRRRMAVLLRMRRRMAALLRMRRRMAALLGMRRRMAALSLLSLLTHLCVGGFADCCGQGRCLWESVSDNLRDIMRMCVVYRDKVGER
jgi:hypothetical protein